MKLYKCKVINNEILDELVRAEDLKTLKSNLLLAKRWLVGYNEILFPDWFDNYYELEKRCNINQLLLITICEWFHIRDLGTTLAWYAYIIPPHLKWKLWPETYKKEWAYMLDFDMISWISWRYQALIVAEKKAAVEEKQRIVSLAAANSKKKKKTN
jgi:hypothetical protein